EVVELLAAVRAEAHVPVEGGLDRGRLEGAVHAGDRRVPGEQVTELGVVAAGDRHRLADREVDVLAVTGVPGAPRRGRHSYRRERARDPLARAAARLDGYVVGRATTHETARLCLHDELGGRSAGVRPRATVRRDGQ